jgi:hypothetical protein
MVWGLDMRFLGGKREKINQGGVNSNRIIQMESCCFSVVSFPVLGFSVLLMATYRGGAESGRFSFDHEKEERRGR